jgi:hypothetical protein
VFSSEDLTGLVDELELRCLVIHLAPYIVIASARVMLYSTGEIGGSWTS